MRESKLTVNEVNVFLHTAKFTASFCGPRPREKETGNDCFFVLFT